MGAPKNLTDGRNCRNNVSFDGCCRRDATGVSIGFFPREQLIVERFHVFRSTCRKTHLGKDGLYFKNKTHFDNKQKIVNLRLATAIPRSYLPTVFTTKTNKIRTVNVKIVCFWPTYEKKNNTIEILNILVCTKFRSHLIPLCTGQCAPGINY